MTTNNELKEQTLSPELQDQIDRLNARFKDQKPQKIMADLIEMYGSRLALASSLGLEDQVLTDMGVALDRDLRIFVLDTGRLHQETYDVMEKTRERYNIEYDVKFPDYTAVETMNRRWGPNSFYKSIENRKQCCAIRKIEPLRRALQASDCWMTGLRRSQSVTRTDLQVVEWDSVSNKIKVNPLIDWEFADVWAYIREHHVPYNALHDRGFPSIGCAPCTRAVKDGEHFRAGRWWWEAPEQKECGLHWVNGKLVRKKNG